MKRFLPIILILTIALISLSLTSRPHQSKKPPSPTPVTSTTPHSAIFYPIPNYSLRLTLRRFGQLLTPKDAATVPCGKDFTGFHTGDDLEILPGEENEGVPVYSVSEGTVASIESVSGYGGLIIISSELAGQPVTLYYGHVSLHSALKRKGASVSPGEKLALLGTGCTNETSGERKHLHFAIHKGKTIDQEGYAQNHNSLVNWLNPKDSLQSLSATSP